MSLALEKVCDALSLKMVDDAATRLIAGEIIALAEYGIRDATTLAARTLEKFRQAPLKNQSAE